MARIEVVVGGVAGVDTVPESPVDAGLLARLASTVLVEEGVAGPGELSLSFVEEKEMALLNEKYRGVKGSTDVLSFAIDTPGEMAEAMPMMLGDVVVCPAVALRNAPEHGNSAKEEMALLVVHGVLHLLGMDHEDPGEAEAMEERERSHLREFSK